MSEELIFSRLKERMHSDLVNNILPYWMNKMTDQENGGFYGRITGNEELIPDSEKGGILNARILWTFSSAYLLLKDVNYLETATRARDYILKHFFDDELGGTYWSIASNGQPSDTKKQIYSQAFMIYAFSEYYRAAGDHTSLEKAIELFHLIERYSFDKEKNGYLEAFSRNWKLLEDLRLSQKDANESKTMNTHLHVLEAYTNLFRVWKDDFLKKQLENLIKLFFEQILDQSTFHLNLFFNEDWKTKSSIVSYGHDIEASWLLYEAAQVLGNPEILKQAAFICEKIVMAATEGLQPDGSLVYEKNQANGHVDGERHWWPQAEAVVGFLNAFELTGNQDYLRKAEHCWDFISETLIDRQNGEWFWSILSDGSINRKDDKAGFWKCPYHNARASLEVTRRFDLDNLL